MMCIQTPGSFVWAISLALREGTKWSSWVTYVVTGILQGSLLTMCIMFELAERAAKKKAGEAAGTVRTGDADAPRENIEALDERAPLLSGQRS